MSFSAIILLFFTPLVFAQSSEESVVNDLERIIQEQTNQLVEHDYNGTILSQTTSIVGVIIGAIIGIVGTVGVNFLFRNNAVNNIEFLVEKDIQRIRRNIEENHKNCVEMINNLSSRTQFVQKMASVVDLQNLDSFAAPQAFNYWYAIMSSANLIHLRSDKISQIQGCYDLTQDFNHDVDAMFNGGRLKNSILATHGAKNALTNNLFLQQRNETLATDEILGLCTGLKSVHEEYYKILYGTLKVFGCIENIKENLT